MQFLLRVGIRDEYSGSEDAQDYYGPFRTRAAAERLEATIRRCRPDLIVLVESMEKATGQDIARRYPIPT